MFLVKRIVGLRVLYIYSFAFNLVELGECTPHSRFSIEFLNVGGWLSRGDLALESTAHFPALAEHPLVAARARTVTTQLRQARRSSVWAPSCQDVTPGGHAGVGVISLHGTPLSLPTLFDPSFKDFFRIGPNDPEKLQLTEHLFAAVLAEARMCCAGQPVILAGGFNADPTVIPPWLRVFQMANGLILSGLLPSVVEYTLPLLVNSNLTKIRPDRSRSSQSHEVHHIWDVYIREVGFVPFVVRERLFRLCNSPDVDSSWLLWSREAEASLARAYLSVGGPHLLNPSSYVGRGFLSIYTMRLGGRCHDRIYHVDRSDEFDVTHFGFFLNFSLAPVLRFRRSFVSVCNVLKGIKLRGFSEARVVLGLIGFLLIFMVFTSGPWTPWLFLMSLS